MKQVINTTITLFALLMALSSCSPSGKNNHSVTLPNKSFNGDDYFARTESIVKMTPDQFNVYQLNRIDQLKDLNLKTEEGVSVVLTETLWESDKAKAVIIVENTEGESAGFLVTYDSQGNYVSSEEIIYQDYVEYYASISSVIKNNVIEVKTVNNEYLDDGSEKSDSTIVSYTIDQSLKINKQQ